MVTSKYFKEAEFKRCSPSCSLQDMNQEFMNTLDNLREKAGIPIVLNSAYRSSAWDKSKGRSGKGAHTKGLAADIRCNSSATRWKIIAAAHSLGICRLGIGKTYIHVDIDKSLTQNVIWHYYPDEQR